MSLHQQFKYMERAIELAERGRGRVEPNPCVGCVIVKGNKVVGEGYHKAYGGPHAEVFALKKAGKKARGATMYLTLEPCDHWGKTPPCAPQLAQAGIKKAYIAMKDPNPVVSGRGIAELKRKGIGVELGLGHEEAKDLNRPYITWITQKRPYVTVKMAMTLDGKTATFRGDSKWISSPASRDWVHKLRSTMDAVMIGANTAIQDNPRLTSHGKGKNPIRVILDPHLRTPKNLHVFNDALASTILITSDKTAKSRLSEYENNHVKILRKSLKFKKFEIRDIIRTLFKINVNQLLIEGGSETIWSFVNEKAVDEFLVFISPIILGGKEAKPLIGGRGVAKIAQGLRLKILSVTPFSGDYLIQAVPI